MAYRRRHGVTRASTFKEESLFLSTHDAQVENDGRSILTTSRTFSPSSSSLAAQAIKASAAYSSDSIPNSFRSSRVFGAYEESQRTDGVTGFWGVLARKAKAILDEDANNKEHEAFSSSISPRFQMPDSETQQFRSESSDQVLSKINNPAMRKGLDKVSSSLNQRGDTIEKSLEEGRSMVENKAVDINQDSRWLQVGDRTGSSIPDLSHIEATSWQPLVQPQQPETQIKASRDVAMATAAKAKLLLRELKTVKAELAFSKLRCSQLEEENKILRDSREKGGNPADDDLIRLQLETLLAEKARLAHENSVYARENRFLREIVEYHQLTMQDVVYLDEGNEEVTHMLSVSPPSPTSPAEDDGPVAISPPSNQTYKAFADSSSDNGVKANVETLPAVNAVNREQKL